MNTDRTIVPVVLCGGAGTRLWPLSRRLEPKQFQRLTGQRTLFQETLARFAGDGFGRPLVLANVSQERLLRRDVAASGPELAPHPMLVLEPAIRSTAPAIAAAAALLRQEGDPLMIVAPSDHHVGRPDILIEAIEAAVPFVEEGGIALFGIEPTSPDTGFGYIETAERRSGDVRRVAAFREKPDAETAVQFLERGNFLWNSGIFLFRAGTILEELTAYAPSVLDAASDALRLAEHHDNAVHLNARFGDAPNVPIDTAVMEKSNRLGVVRVSPEWDDLGTFEALRRCGESDKAGNTTLGEVVLEGVSDSYVRADSRLVCVHGVSDLAVVETADAVLVGPLADATGLKRIVGLLGELEHPAGNRHRADSLPPAFQHRGEGQDKNGHDVRRLYIEPGGEVTVPEVSEGMSRTILVLRGVADLHVSTEQSRLVAGESKTTGNSKALRLRNCGHAPAVAVICAWIGQDAALGLRKVS